jgi:hypothetical protein
MATAYTVVNIMAFPNGMISGLFYFNTTIFGMEFMPGPDGIIITAVVLEYDMPSTY